MTREELDPDDIPLPEDGWFDDADEEDAVDDSDAD